MSSALAMYTRVVQIWQAALSSHSNAYVSYTCLYVKQANFFFKYRNTPRMAEAQQVECQHMMLKILTARESAASKTSVGK